MQRALLGLSFFVYLSACAPDDHGAINSLSDPLEAPPHTWTWVPVEGAVCADGSPTGFAVNLSDPDADLLIFLEGGGACRNYLECIVLKTSVFLDGYDESTFRRELPEVDAPGSILSRSDPGNPLAHTNMAFIPYCTGDLHAGQNAHTYRGTRSPFYHVGGQNYALFLDRLSGSFAAPQAVWLAGFSAGGFGAVLNFDSTAAAFPTSVVHMINDSGLSFSDSPEIPAHWRLAPPPPDCQSCLPDVSAWATYLARQHPNSRMAYLSFLEDSTLPTYLLLTSGRFTADIASYAKYLDGLALPNFKYFYAAGTGHGVIQANPTTHRVSVSQWLAQFTSDPAAWQSQLP